jgi:hypothetical protein
VDATWSPGATITNTARHQFEIRPDKKSDSLELVCGFRPEIKQRKTLPSLRPIPPKRAKYWNQFLETGGAIDLSGSKDPRWFELERRIVLSQYLTAIQDAGKNPPQETGLTYNTWEGKFHLEMHWWHEAHFALWNRLPLLEKSLGYYQTILPRAEATAKKAGLCRRALAQDDQPQRRGIAFARSGRFSSGRNRIPIFYAELCYRAHGDRATLEKYKDIVFRRRISWPAMRPGTRTRNVTCSARRCKARRKFFRRTKPSIRRSS